MVINNCNVAETYDGKFNLTTYTDTACATNERITETIEWFAVNTKIMTKDYHDPDLYY